MPLCHKNSLHNLINQCTVVLTLQELGSRTKSLKFLFLTNIFLLQAATTNGPDHV